MEKQDIIRKFLDLGCMVDGHALEAMWEKPELVDRALQKITSGQKPHTITTDWLGQKSQVEIITSQQQAELSITPDDVTRALQKRYDMAQELLSAQLQDTVSINKISPKTKKFSLITMIREKDGNTLLVEDDTGEAKVNLKKDVADRSRFLVEDEIVGLVCEQSEGILVDQIVWPDIPSRREVAKSNEDVICIFAANIPTGRKLPEKLLTEDTYAFTFGSQSQTKDGIFFTPKAKPTKTIQDPSTIRVGNVHILLSSAVTEYARLWDVTPEVACQNLLKKRNFNPRINLGETIDTSVSDIPDIIVCPTHGEPASLNYKGTTIISTSYPTCWSVNLKTRETFKINIA